MTTALLIAAFMMGFLGSPHCLGMCGGLVAAFSLSMKDVSPAKRNRLIATYHFGRLLSYSILGLVAGLIGVTILEPLMRGNSTPRILLGMVLVFVGITMLGAPFLRKLEHLGMRFWQRLSPLRQKIFPLNTYPRALGAGLLWGYLPCGLVYGALLIAIVAHNPLGGAALMFVFGLGTVPMLVATHKTVGWMREKIGRLRLRQINGIIMVLSGLAVVFVPMVMQSMHSADHSQMGHAPMDHGSSSTTLSENGQHGNPDMNNINHDMDNMNHDMDNMNHDMDNMNHDMDNMNHHSESATPTQ